MDLSKLSPAPWERAGAQVWSVPKDDAADGDADLDFAVLARNAFDVMVRRGWGVSGTPMCMVIPAADDPQEFQDWADGHYEGNPFAAILAADAWYGEHCEGEKAVE